MSATAAIVVIGAEVLSAKLVDENGPFLLDALRKRGIDVRELRVIGDDVDTIAKTVRELAAAHGTVITTGGVGPTHDDVTIEGVAAAFGTAVHRNSDLVTRISGYYGDTLQQAALKMAEVPVGSVVQVAPNTGFVPIIRMNNVYILPGVPSLVRRCYRAIENELAHGTFFTQALYFNVVESFIADTLTDVQRSYPDVAIGSYPRFDDAGYLVKVTLDGRDHAKVDAASTALHDRIDPEWFTKP